jgi:hypothetical protein
LGSKKPQSGDHTAGQSALAWHHLCHDYRPLEIIAWVLAVWLV